MQTRIPLTPFMLPLALLVSCSSPPKPPAVDESRKRPANTAMAVDLQVCRNELQNTRLLATENTRRAQASAATLASITAHQQALADLHRRDRPPPQANSIYTVQFEYGSSRFDLAPDRATSLIDEAKAAPLVLLRGRTDGDNDTPAEARIARQRAAAVREFLVTAGVDPSRIRSTYQPAGDHVADNASAAGRALNRRVEIEIYRAMPAAKELARRGDSAAGGDHHG
ncbi:OmpA family protein [Pelomonas cellulosilytica]|uniref:OmpA family protein n=1 Tax=Pelomonas cellulosilytica TaxID=2906762 RepID=A0ABS8Y2T0_9BURK|nr:OmpA family protein [Pelomonas sp. P8]MCE4557995.1 OmpA family protein [Pelomonas sp. P8]